MRSWSATPWLTKVCPTSSSSITWELLEVQNLRHLPRDWSQIHILTRSSRLFVYTLQSTPHWTYLLSGIGTEAKLGDTHSMARVERAYPEMSCGPRPSQWYPQDPSLQASFPASVVKVTGVSSLRCWGFVLLIPLKSKKTQCMLRYKIR